MSNLPTEPVVLHTAEVDLRTLQEIMHTAKPGERLVVTHVMSTQGVAIFSDEAFIQPYETARGDLAFQCHYPDGTKLSITAVDSFLWSIENEQ